MVAGIKPPEFLHPWRFAVLEKHGDAAFVLSWRPAATHEEIGKGIVEGCKSLQLLRRFESPRNFIAHTHWLIRIFGAVVDPLC